MPRFAHLLATCAVAKNASFCARARASNAHQRRRRRHRFLSSRERRGGLAAVMYAHILLINIWRSSRRANAHSG